MKQIERMRRERVSKRDETCVCVCVSQEKPKYEPIVYSILEYMDNIIINYYYYYSLIIIYIIIIMIMINER